MAVTDQQKLDFLLKKIGYTKTKTGSVVGTGAISGTPKQPFAEAIPSPLVVPNASLWNEADSIPATAPGSDTTQVKVYLAATSGLRMTADSTSSGQRAYIAYSTYNNTSSARLTNWIDTQFGASYLIKVYKGDPNSGGVALSAAGSGSNDGWFFDYSAGVLNFNDTSVPSGVTDTNIYIVGYRYVGQTGAPTSGISTFSYLDLTVERNLDVGVQGGISTFRNNIDANGIIEGIAGENKIPFLYSNLAALPNAGTYHGMFAHVHSEGRGYFAHAGNWLELVNKDTNGNVGLSGDLDVDGHTNLDNLSVAGVSTFTGDTTFSGSVSIGGTLTYEDVTNVDSVGLLTARSGIRVTGGVIEALAGENKIPSLYATMGNLPSAGTYHGMFAHVHNQGKGYFAHGGAWYELVNKELNGRVGTGTESYFIDRLVSTSTTATSLNVVGVATFGGNVDVNGNIFDADGHVELDNVNIVGVTTVAGDILPATTNSHNLGTNNAGGIGNGRFKNAYFSSSVWILDSPAGFMLGNSFDTKFYHSGTSSFIDHQGAGAFGIRSNNGINFSCSTSGGETAMQIVKDGGIKLYHNFSGTTSSTLRFETTGQGINVIGHSELDNVNISGVTTTAGNVDINADLDVDGHTNLDNVSIAGVVTATTFVGNGDFVELDVDGHTNLDNVSIAGVTTFAGNIDANGNLDVDGTTDLDVLNVAEAATFSSSAEFDGNAKFDSTITAGGATGTSGQYLKSTGSGVAWASFPTARTSQAFTASAGQTTFSFSYTVGLVDVFVNGIKLSTSEFTATNGSSVVLAVGCFVGDIVEILSYNTATGGGGGGTLSNIVEDTTPQLGGNLDLFSKTINGTGGINITGVVTATSFVGDGSALTGVVGSGSGVVIQHDGSNVGTAGTINFSTNLDVTPISAGIVTVTASGGGSGITTAEVRANTLVVTGVSTFSDNINLAADDKKIIVGADNDLELLHTGGNSVIKNTTAGSLLIHGNSIDLRPTTESGEVMLRATRNAGVELRYDNTKRFEVTNTGSTVVGTIVADGADINGDIDVDGHTELDNVNIAGVVTATTFKGAVQATSGTFSSGVDITGDLDVDGHTDLDNVSVAGVVTATSFVGDGSALTNLPAGSSDNISEGNTKAEVSDTGTNGRFFVETEGTEKFSIDSTGDFIFNQCNDSVFNANGNLTIDYKTSNSIRLRQQVTSSAINNILFSVPWIIWNGSDATNISIHRADKIQVGSGVSIGVSGNIVATGIVTATSFVGDGSGLTGITASGSGVVIKHDGSTVGTAGTINFGTNLDVSAISGGAVTITASGGGVSLSGSTNNTVATVTGANALIGEANLTFDGSTLGISAGSSDNKIQIDGTNPYIQFREGTTNKAYIQWSGGGYLQLGNEEAGEVLRLGDGESGLIWRVGSNNRTVWTSGNDGASSGLDADLLDGQEGSYYSPNVGITTNLSGSFTASAGSPSTINTYGYGSGDIVVEYTIFIKNGSDFQSQKLLAMRDGTTIHSTQFAVMYSSSLLVQCDATINSGNILLRATPETGVSGSTTYKVKREVM